MPYRLDKVIEGEQEKIIGQTVERFRNNGLSLAQI